MIIYLNEKVLQSGFCKRHVSFGGAAPSDRLCDTIKNRMSYNASNALLQQSP